MDVHTLDQQPLEHFATCLEHESWGRQQLLDYQARALHACRAYAYAHAPFYRRHHQGLLESPLQDLPVLTKAMVMEHFDDLVTDRAIHLDEVRQYMERADSSKLFLDRYRVTATSGSTGQPGIFLYSRGEGAIVANSFSRFQRWGGITARSKAAVIASATPAHMTSQLPVVIDGQAVPRIHLASTDSLDTMVQRLNEWQPDALLSYASMAAVLANEQLQGRLHIAPRSLFCSGETLTNEMRQRIEEAWQHKIINVYGMTESGVLASECPQHQGFHLFEDFSIVEVVDEHYRPVPPGEVGAKVLLTVLFRRVQPLIRYEVSDPLCLSALVGCACGRPFASLESIAGRTPEMLYFPTVTGREDGLAPLQFQTIFDMLPISGWQIIQDTAGLHILLLGASEQLRDEDVLVRVRQVLAGRGAQVPPLEVQRVSALVENAGGKIPMLISRLPRQTS
jgi:putative adenylate-forming enzyme